MSSSNYQTLLGSYRMSGSSTVLPPPTQNRPGSAATLVQYRVQNLQATANNNNNVKTQHFVKHTAVAAANSNRQAAAADEARASATNNNNSSAAATPASSSVLTQAQRTSGGTNSKAAQLVAQQQSHHANRIRSSMYHPKLDPSIRRHPLQHRPTLILDLDETLVHATTQRPHSHSAAAKFDLHFDVDMGPHNAPVPVWVGIRPHARDFLFDVASYFEIVVFTASIKNYADQVCDALDPQGRFIHHRLYRDHCSDVDGVFVKDLSLLNRPLQRIAILDNSPHAYLFHPENAIPIVSWFDNEKDHELKKMTPMLVHRLSQSDDVYDILNHYRQTV